VLKELKELKVQEDPKEVRVLLGPQEPLVHKVPEDHKELRGHKVLWDLKGFKELLE
jgi:hypothetical protein